MPQVAAYITTQLQLYIIENRKKTNTYRHKKKQLQFTMVFPISVTCRVKYFYKNSPAVYLGKDFTFSRFVIKKNFLYTSGKDISFSKCQFTDAYF